MTNMTPVAAFGPVPKPGSRPIAVQVWRGPLAESEHRVACAVADADGRLVAGWGELSRPVYPRSAVKPLQALPLVETGAADRFAVGDPELALACASHGGEPVHVETARRWLDRIGLSADDLECGSHWPSHEASMRNLVARGETPSALHNNCSGKHAGMLTTARHLGEPHQGYVSSIHPVQRRIRAILEDLGGASLADAPIGIDGCSIPTLGMPLDALARAMARLGTPDGLAPARAAACRRIAAAMLAHPYMVAGEGRVCTALMQAGGGRILSKAGAEGVYMAALPHRGIGIAVKALDGGARAANAALGAVLEHLGVLDDAIRAAIAPFAQPTLANWRWITTGRIAAARDAGF